MTRTLPLVQYSHPEELNNQGGCAPVAQADSNSPYVVCVKHSISSEGTEALPPMDSHEVCEYLDITPGYLYTLCRKGRIPYSKPSGGRLRFERDEIMKWSTNFMTLCPPRPRN